MKRKSKKPISEAESEGQRSPVRDDLGGDGGGDGGGKESETSPGSGSNKMENQFDKVIVLLKGYLTRLAATEDEGDSRQLIDEGKIVKHIP